MTYTDTYVDTYGAAAVDEYFGPTLTYAQAVSASAGSESTLGRPGRKTSPLWSRVSIQVPYVFVKTAGGWVKRTSLIQSDLGLPTRGGGHDTVVTDTELVEMVTDGALTQAEADGVRNGS